MNAEAYIANIIIFLVTIFFVSLSSALAFLIISWIPKIKNAKTRERIDAGEAFLFGAIPILCAILVSMIVPLSGITFILILGGIYAIIMSKRFDMNPWELTWTYLLYLILTYILFLMLSTIFIFYLESWANVLNPPIMS